MKLRTSVAAFLVLAVGLSTAKAQLFWDANGTNTGGSDTTVANGSWGVDSFWNADPNGDAAPGAWIVDEIANFSAGTNVTGASAVALSGSQSVGGINFQEGTVTISGGTELFLTGSTIDVTSPAAGVISSVVNGVTGVTKTGTGTLTLSGANTFTGTVNVNGGTLSVGTGADPAARNLNLGNTANSLALNNSTLQITASIGGDQTNPNTRNISLTNNNTIALTAGSATWHNGIITGTGSLTKTGSVTLVLLNQSSDYTGDTIITQGTLVSAGANSLGLSPTIRLNALAAQTATFRMSALPTDYVETRALSIEAVGGQLDSSNPTSTVAEYAGVISSTGAHGLTKIGAGIMKISNASNSWSGATTVSNGVLQFTNTAAWPSTTQVTVNSGGTLGVNAGGGGSEWTNSSVSTDPASIASLIAGTDGEGNANQVIWTAGSAVGIDTTNAGGSMTYSGQIGQFYTGGGPLIDTAGVNKLGTGTLVLDNASNTTVARYTVTAGELQLAYAATVGSLAGAGDLNFGANNLSVGNDNTDATFSGRLIGTGALSKIGTGTQTLSGDNTTGGLFAGAIDVFDGTLHASNPLSLGVPTDFTPLTVHSGGTLRVSGSGNTFAQPVFISGAGFNSTGAIRKTGSGTVTMSGGITLSAAARIQSEQATLVINSQPLVIGANDVTIAGTATGTTGNVTMTSQVDGSGNIIKEGQGILTMDSGVHQGLFTGKFRINGGTVSFQSDNGFTNNLGPTPVAEVPDFFILNGGTLLDANPSSAISFMRSGRGVQIGPNGGTISYVSNDSNTTDADVALWAGIIRDGGAAPGDFMSVLTKAGRDEIRMSGAAQVHTFDKLVIKEGIYGIGTGTTLGQDSQLGAVPGSPLADAITLDGGILRFLGGATPITVNANRGIVITSTATSAIQTDTANAVIPGIISGPGVLRKIVGGLSLTLSGENTYSGGTLLTVGTLVVNGASATLGTGDLTVNGGTLTITNALANTVTVPNFSGTGGTVSIASGRTLSVSGGSLSTSFAGTISGAGALNKGGAGGSLTLSRAAGNTYSGSTTVTGGSLLVTNTSGSGTGTGAVSVSGTGTLGGTGIISGTVTVDSGGAVAPGTSIGTLAMGGLTLNAGSILNMELGAPSTSDLLNVTGSGALNIAGSTTVNLTNAGGVAAGTYTLIDYAGTLGGLFSNLTIGTNPGMGLNYSLVDTGSTIDLSVVAAPTNDADFNGDGVIDAADWAVWQKFNPTAAPNGNQGNGDADGDTDVDTTDEALWQSTFGNLSPGAGSGGGGGGAVPEPSTVAMLMIALSAMASRRRGR